MVPVEDESTVVVAVRHPPVDVHYPPPARRDVGGWTDSYRPPPRPEDTFAGRFTAPLSITPRPVSNHPKGIHSDVVAAGVALVALAGWLLWPSGDSDAAKPTVASPPPTTDVEAQEQLMNVLPPGYPSDACTPIEAPEDAAVVVDCVEHPDTDGPPSATYTLWTDEAALADVVGDLKVVNCPGNVQSPGPWRRNATPQRTAGTLVCGLGTGGRPVVAWTTDAALVLNVVRADPQPVLQVVVKPLLIRQAGVSSTPDSTTASSRSGAVTTAGRPSPSFQMLHLERLAGEHHAGEPGAVDCRPGRRRRRAAGRTMRLAVMP